MAPIDELESYRGRQAAPTGRSAPATALLNLFGIRLSKPERFGAAFRTAASLDLKQPLLSANEGDRFEPPTAGSIAITRGLR